MAHPVALFVWWFIGCFVVDTATYALTAVPVTFRYFRLELATRELDLTMNAIDLRYFNAALTTQTYAVTANAITFELA